MLAISYRKFWIRLRHMHDSLDEHSGAILSHQWAWNNFRLDVFSLFALGYQDAKDEIQPEHLEENITGLLRKAMHRRLSSGLGIPEHFILYNMKNEDPVDDTGKLGTSRPRVDVTVEHTGNRPYRHYIFEAKRCYKSYKGGIKWFAEGIESFIKRDYARDAPEASVVGLVQSDTCEEWREKLKVHVAGEPSLNCKSLPADVTLTPDLKTIAVYSGPICQDRNRLSLRWNPVSSC
jgi:hypothetical protein